MKHSIGFNGRSTLYTHPGTAPTYIGVGSSTVGISINLHGVAIVDDMDDTDDNPSRRPSDKIKIDIPDIAKDLNNPSRRIDINLDLGNQDFFDQFYFN